MLVTVPRTSAMSFWKCFVMVLYHAGHITESNHAELPGTAAV